MEKPKTDQQNSRIRPGLAVAVVVILGALIGLIAWLGPGRKGANQTSAEGSAPEAASSPAEGQATASAPNLSPTAKVRPTTAVLPSPPNQPGQPAPGTPLTSEQLKPGEWEQRLDDVLGSNENEAQKATRLLEMFPLLPEDGQIEIAQHLSNLLPDDRYSALSQTLTNAAAPEGVLDVLMTDVLNRPNSLKLPTLLQVARTPNHPKADEARDVLEVFVDENYGTDWAKWEKAIQDWLKENPDEPTETVAK
jgi:hypothetical protein